MNSSLYSKLSNRPKGGETGTGIEGDPEKLGTPAVYWVLTWAADLDIL